MLALARLYLTMDDLDSCQQQCVQLLKMDSENDAATVVSTSIDVPYASDFSVFFFAQSINSLQQLLSHQRLQSERFWSYETKTLYQVRSSSVPAFFSFYFGLIYFVLCSHGRSFVVQHVLVLNNITLLCLFGTLQRHIRRVRSSYGSYFSDT